LVGDDKTRAGGGGSRRIGFVTSTIMDIDLEHNQVTVTADSKETKFRYDFPYIYNPFSIP
jgi:hypothetical protein